MAVASGLRRREMISMRWYIISRYVYWPPAGAASGLIGISQLGKLVIGHLDGFRQHIHRLTPREKQRGCFFHRGVFFYRSNESDVRVSCQTHVHQSLLRIICFVLASGGRPLRPSEGVVARCRPKDCAKRHVSPVNAQDASAFISLSRTKLVRSKAWMESKEGLT